MTPTKDISRKKTKTSEEQNVTEAFTPREYQIEILEIAKKQNTIACLGTGTGKTFIAVMLIREYANPVRKEFKKGGKRIFFLVPTVPLVMQQSATIQQHTDLRVGHYYGDMNVDSWNVDKWTQEFEKNEVLVMTAEIFRIIVDHVFIPLDRIHLLIIDECHRAKKDHPYRIALKRFADMPDYIAKPRIFGLSASLLNGKCKPSRVEKELIELEKTLQSSITTASDVEDLQKYGTDPDEYIVMHEDFNYQTIMVQKINELRQKLKARADLDSLEYDENITFLDKPSKSLNALLMTLTELGPWCAWKAAEVFSKEMATVLSKTVGGAITKEHQNLLQEVQDFLLYFIKECRKFSDFNLNSCLWPHKFKRLLEIYSAVSTCSRFQDSSLDTTIARFEEDPEEYAKFMMKTRNCSKNDICSIIFVEQRITAYVLNQWLLETREKDPKFSFLKPDFIVGHGNIGIGVNELSEKKQKKVLQKFRANETNVLIATSVLEEGMDVKQCNIIVRFDIPRDFRAYVQSKGRARAKNSIYVLLTSPGEKYGRLLEDLCAFKTVEKMLMSKCYGRSMPEEEDIKDALSDDVLPPYKPYGPNGPCISLGSAIALINRYCAKLPCDMASKLVPKWSIRKVEPENGKAGYECTLRMPINSSLRKPIVGEIMKKKKHTKMAAALKACQLLHEIGELNENLVPVSHLVEDALEDEIGIDDETTTDGSIPGTNRRRQVYDKHVPIFLQNCRPRPGISCYLHILRMELAVPLPNCLNPRNRPLMYPNASEKDLAILTTRKLPQVNPFPIFTKSGKILVTVHQEAKEIFLPAFGLGTLENFHKFVFSDTISVSECLNFSPESAEMPFYVVPVVKVDNSYYDIDWNFLKSIHGQEYRMLKQSAHNVPRTAYPIKRFEDAVVIKSYRSSERKSGGNAYYHVTKIMYEMSPRSDMDKSLTFEEYYKNKYNVTIQNLNQPLLEVVSHFELHLWKPLYTNVREIYDDSPLSNTKLSRMQHREYLIPELSIIHPFPAPFFYKILYLPTILFRLRCLLLAEEVRQRVAADGLIGTVELANNVSWPVFNLESSDKQLMQRLMELKAVNVNLSNLKFARDIVKVDDKIVSFLSSVQIEDNPGPSPSLLLQALTTTSASDEFDLERLEMIGDSFLKYVMSIKIYMKYGNFDEGKLSKLRSGLISNRYLYRCSKKKGLPTYMTHTCFSCCHTWLAPCYTVEEYVDPKVLIKRKKSERCKDDSVLQTIFFTKQIIPDKCVADSVEALIGAYLLSCGQRGALMFMSWLGLRPLPIKNEENVQLSDFQNWPPVPPNPLVVPDMPNVKDCLERLTNGLDRFESIINYRFKNKAYLLQAFTHPSYAYNEITDCYQRLEFLGDAVLDYMITRQLYEDPSDHSPGKLTDLRSALVNNAYFASLAVKFKYHKFLRMLSPHLHKLLDQYVKVLEESDYFKFFEEYGYHLEEIECIELEEIEVPKALGDIFESVAGAIYLDSGMSLDTVWGIYYPMIEPALKHLCENVPINPVRRVYELLGKEAFGEPLQVEDTGKTYIKIALPHGMEVVGVGPNKKVAKRSAAKRALIELRKLENMVSLQNIVN